jgi:hypothetical protein
MSQTSISRVAPYDSDQHGNESNTISHVRIL